MPLVFTEKKTNHSAIDVKKMMSIGGQMHDMLNKDVVNKFGVDAIYFRAIPVKDSSDVIFQDYTLLGVENCPTPIKVIFSDQAYNQGELGVSIYELGYNVPLELQIPAIVWYEAYGQGTMPQKDDIVYIPVLHRLFEVDSTSEVFGYMQQFTHFKAVMKKYNPKQFRGEGEGLMETIDNYTTGIAELLGGEITEEIADIVDDQQTNPYNSTPWDNYKYIPDSKVVLEHPMYIGGSEVFKMHYDLSKVKPNTVAVDYKDWDEVKKDDFRLLSLWVKPSFKKETLNYIGAELLEGRERINGIAYETIRLKRNAKTKGMSEGDTYTITFGRKIKKELILNKQEDGYDEYLIPFAERLSLDKMLPQWKSIKAEVELTNTINILSSPNNGYTIELGTDHMEVSLASETAIIPFDSELKPDIWYGISISFSPSTVEVKIYKERGKTIALVASGSASLQPIEGVYNYELIGGEVSLSNIRLYKSTKPYSDKARRADLLSKRIMNGSMAVICDTVDELYHEDGIYVGRQR